MEKRTSASRQSSQKSTPTMPGEQHDVAEDRDEAGGEQLVQGVDVGGHPGHQAADRVPVEEGERQALQVPEDLPAQVVHDVLPHQLQHVPLRVERWRR